MVSEVEDRIIGIGSGFEIEDYWKPGQKIRKMVSQPITPPAGVTPEIRILEKSQDFRGLIVKHSFSLRSRRGVRQKFAEGMLIWWVPKRLFCKLFLWSCKFFPWGLKEKFWSFLEKVPQKWIVWHNFRCLCSSKTQKLMKNLNITENTVDYWQISWNQRVKRLGMREFSIEKWVGLQILAEKIAFSEKNRWVLKILRKKW